MTREELNKLIMQACERTWNEKTCEEIEQALSQEPCDDVISRQAVLDLVNSDWKYEGLETDVASLPPVTQKSETVTEFADRCRECGARYGKLLEQKSWIPVSKRLPEDGDYLVTVERIDGEPRIDIKSFAKDLNRVDEFDFPKHKCGWYDYDSEYGFWEDTRVTAWMPLPKPYEPQERSDKECTKKI